MKIIITGDIEFNNFEYMCTKLDHVLQRLLPDIEIICTGKISYKDPGKPVSGFVPEGACYHAMMYARKRKLRYTLMNPKFRLYGKEAVRLNDVQMLEQAFAVISFTNLPKAFLLGKAGKRDLPFRKITYENKTA